MNLDWDVKLQFSGADLRLHGPIGTNPSPALGVTINNPKSQRRWVCLVTAVLCGNSGWMPLNNPTGHVC